jgi:hypothetical protein
LAFVENYFGAADASPEPRESSSPAGGLVQWQRVDQTGVQGLEMAVVGDGDLVAVLRRGEKTIRQCAGGDLARRKRRRRRLGG